MDRFRRLARLTNGGRGDAEVDVVAAGPDAVDTGESPVVAVEPAVAEFSDEFMAARSGFWLTAVIMVSSGSS